MGSYGPIDPHKEWEPEAFKKRNIDLMTAVIVWALVIAVVIFLVGGAISLTMWLFF